MAAAAISLANDFFIWFHFLVCALRTGEAYAAQVRVGGANALAPSNALSAVETPQTLF
jgi:hypothetical protein